MDAAAAASAVAAAPVPAVATVDESMPQYDFDFAVVGGGSGGLAAAKEASKKGARVVCFDFVKPSPAGTTWGLGGTCVNVGCIPKKLMHYSGLLHKRFDDAKHLGWQFPEEPKHSWTDLTDSIGAYIGSLNFGYRTSLMDAKVKYENAYAVFRDAHTIEYTDKKSKQLKTITFKYALLATGGRPNYPDIPGWELGISSDDIFSYYKAPGKSLVVGASYIALECAGFLNHLGYDTSVMVRSILLRGFDQQCANMIGDVMVREGVKFIRPAVPQKLEKTADDRINVTYLKEDSKETVTETYDTVLWAVGRTAVTSGMGLETTGVHILPNKKIPVDENERTNVENIFAIGDCIEGRPELTPVAIKSGVLLAQRLFAGATKKMDYNLVPTTVFTPIEYGAIGWSEETAREKLGDANVEVYLSKFGITEWAACHRVDKDGVDMVKVCFAKLVCDKTRNDRVVGFHIVGPDAGEMTQGYATALRCGATKADFDDTVGIHPTTVEELHNLVISLSSGEPWEKVGGC